MLSRGFSEILYINRVKITVQAFLPLLKSLVSKTRSRKMN